MCAEQVVAGVADESDLPQRLPRAVRQLWREPPIMKSAARPHATDPLLAPLAAPQAGLLKKTIVFRGESLIPIRPHGQDEEYCYAEPKRRHSKRRTRHAAGA